MRVLHGAPPARIRGSRGAGVIRRVFRPQVRGDLVRSLQELRKKLHKFDMVLFETTGLADPAPIMKTFQQPEIHSHFRIVRCPSALWRWRSLFP